MVYPTMAMLCLQCLSESRLTDQLNLNSWPLRLVAVWELCIPWVIIISKQRLSEPFSSDPPNLIKTFRCMSWFHSVMYRPWLRKMKPPHIESIERIGLCDSDCDSDHLKAWRDDGCLNQRIHSPQTSCWRLTNLGNILQKSYPNESSWKKLLSLTRMLIQSGWHGVFYWAAHVLTIHDHACHQEG